MANSVTIQVNMDSGHEKLETQSADPKQHAINLSNFFKSLASGCDNAEMVQFTDDVALAYASGTCTVASIQADDTITINGTTITGKASPSGESQFDSDGSDTVVATAIAACINAHSSFAGICTATSSAAVVTVQASLKGYMGNCITLASSNGSRLAVSAARLAGGTGSGEAGVSYSLGKA